MLRDKGKEKKKVVSANLKEVDYVRLKAYLKKTNQTITEFSIMAIAVFLRNPDKEVVRSERQKGYLKRHTITIRVSEYLYDSVVELAKKKDCSMSELIIEAIKDNMK
mgnify:CR=1 FL=1